jgi:hypothetical protein
VVVSYWKLASLPGGEGHWAEVVRRLEEMERRGVLAPTGRKYLDQARAKAAAR